VILGAIEQSSVSDLPDLFCFGLLGNFQGYRPGYSTLFAKEHDRVTWAILKAHTLNNAGTVTLRSANPLEAPLVNFHYFDEGSDKADKDLEAVVEGIQFVRKVADKLDVLEPEEFPGRDTSTPEQLKQFVKDNAWGHHASCTCRIGSAKDPGAVLDSNFQVNGVKGLRVVDASIFPKIPGFFIVSSIYMAAEKAADVIHRRLGKSS
jgi:choline dehydrogenase-like flavoprotein